MQKTLGLILKKQNIGETDRIITIFSPTLGKKRVVARAVRKTTSKLAGHLDTFMVSQLILTDAVDLPKVTSAQLIEPFEALRGSLVSLNRAFAVSKIVERVILEDVSQQSIFQLTLDTLARMNDGALWENVWLFFLGRLTHQLGLAVDNYRCAQCGEHLNEKGWWLPEARQFVCQKCGRPAGETLSVAANSVKLLRLVQTQSYATVERIRLGETVGCQAEEILLREITQWFNKPWLSYASLRTV